MTALRKSRATGPLSCQRTRPKRSCLGRHFALPGSFCTPEDIQEWLHIFDFNNWRAEMQWCCWTAFNAQDSPTQQRFTQPKMSTVMEWDSKFPSDSKIQLILETERRWIDGSQGGDTYTPGSAAAELCGILTKALEVTSWFPLFAEWGSYYLPQWDWAAEGLAESLNR